MLRAAVGRMRAGAAAALHTRAGAAVRPHWIPRLHTPALRMHTAAADPSPPTSPSPAATSAAAASSCALATVPPSPPDDTLLASSILLSRLSDHDFSPDQVREIIEHLLTTHVLTLKELSDSHLRPPGEFRAAPLSRAGYEVMLTALQNTQDWPLFERVWNRMVAQFAPSSAGGPLFHPSAMMYLCRMSLQMQQRALDAMEDTFRSWKKSVTLSTAAAAKDPSLAALVITPPNLLAYHLMLRRLLLTEDSSPDCAAKCMRILQEIKSAAGVKSKEEMEHDAENGTPQAASKKADPSLKPTRLTYHLLLQSLLSHSKRDLRHLTPLLLDLEGQWGLKPTLDTYSIAMSVCLEAAKQAQNAAKPVQPAHGDTKASVAAAQRERAQASAHLAESWKVANQLWRSVQALAAGKHAAAEKARNARIAKDKRETPPIDPTSTFAQPPPPPPPPATPPVASFIPAALWRKYLDLGLEVRQAQACFDMLLSMQRDAAILPTPAQIPEILRACVSVAEMAQPPQPKATVAADAVPGAVIKDEEDIAIEMREWTKSCRAIQSLQQKALSTALSMMRAAATHAARSNRPVSLDHYMSVFSVLSSLGRVEEFAKLWRHFMAQHTAAEKAAAEAAAAKSPPETDSPSLTPLPLSSLSDLVRFALKLDDAAVVELSQSVTDDAEDADVSADDVSSAGGELAFSICAFWARRIKGAKPPAIRSATVEGADSPSVAATTTPQADATSAPTTNDQPVAAAVADAGQGPATTAAVTDVADTDATSAAPPTPSAFADLSASAFVPALSALSSPLRSALLASLLAGDHSAEFKIAFDAHKLIVFEEENAQQHKKSQQQRKKRNGPHVGAGSEQKTTEAKQETTVESSSSS